MRDNRRRRDKAIRRSGLIAAPRQRIAAQLAAYRRGAPPDDPANLTTRCAGFIKPRHLDALVQVELIILRSHRNSGLCRRCTWRVNLGSHGVAIADTLPAGNPKTVTNDARPRYLCASDLRRSTARPRTLGRHRTRRLGIAGMFAHDRGSGASPGFFL